MERLVHFGTAVPDWIVTVDGVEPKRITDAGIPVALLLARSHAKHPAQFRAMLRKPFDIRRAEHIVEALYTLPETVVLENQIINVVVCVV